MAFIKPAATPFGVTATYHHIAAVQIHYPALSCDVILSSYLDEAARRNGAQPLGSLPVIRIAFAELVMDEGAEPGRAALYHCLAGRAEWADAQAC